MLQIERRCLQAPFLFGILSTLIGKADDKISMIDPTTECLDAQQDGAEASEILVTSHRGRSPNVSESQRFSFCCSMDINAFRSYSN